MKHDVKLITTAAAAGNTLRKIKPTDDRDCGPKHPATPVGGWAAATAVASRPRLRFLSLESMSSPSNLKPPATGNLIALCPWPRHPRLRNHFVLRFPFPCPFPFLLPLSIAFSMLLARALLVNTHRGKCAPLCIPSPTRHSALSIIFCLIRKYRQ